LLREYDCHERVPVDLDAERDGVRRNRRESMSRAKTLVTGATGMTGSHTVQLLLKRGHTVRVLAHSEDERSMRLQELGAEVVIGDMLNLNDVRLALSGIRGAYFVYPPGLIVGTPAGFPLGIAHPQNGACQPGRKQWSWPQCEESCCDHGWPLRTF